MKQLIDQLVGKLRVRAAELAAAGEFDVARVFLAEACEVQEIGMRRDFKWL
jgi:hypothetical protein